MPHERKRPREEGRSPLALLSRLPAWALEVWRQLRTLPASELRASIEALRGLVRLLEDVLAERYASQAEAGGSSGGRSGAQGGSQEARRGAPG